MYFHLIWIKEKAWKQYDLDILLSWWDENFLRDFLAHRWVVIVSLTEYKEDVDSFWNILISTEHNDVTINIIASWENLEDYVYTMAFIGLTPKSINLTENPISNEESEKIIQSIITKINEENEKIKQAEEENILKEQKKYKETWLETWLKIINQSIDHIEQVIKAWNWIISSSDLKKLEDYLNEMKKIRLWTNFNKMANLVLDADILLKNAENQIIETHKSKNFLISPKSSITNIDILTEQLNYNKVHNKTVFMPKALSASESMIWVLWSSSIFLNLLSRDLTSDAKKTSFDTFFWVLMNMIEYIVLTASVVLCISWIIATLLWSQKFSLYLLPAFWWLWLLVYLFNNLNIKWTAAKIIWFIALAGIYWYGLILLLNTFSL